MCGGTVSKSPIRTTSKGLSPRVRGNLSALSPPACAHRSIPACAGEPGWSEEQTESTKVYPRVCGGTSSPPYLTSDFKGLSPRVRGNQGMGPLGISRQRSIPACAGEPFLVILMMCLMTVYPRVCGGTACVRSEAVCSQGLSPRVRGNRTRTYMYSGSRRSIPACAGEPDRP